METTRARVSSTISVYAANSTTSDAAHTGIRLSSLARSGWNTIVSERASTTGADDPCGRPEPGHDDHDRGGADQQGASVRDSFMACSSGGSSGAPATPGCRRGAGGGCRRRWIGVGRCEQVGRGEHEAAVLPAAEAAVAADQRLEGRHVERVGVEGAVDVDAPAPRAIRVAVSSIGRGVVAEREPAGRRPRPRRWRGGGGRAPRSPPDRRSPRAADEADARVPGEARDQGGPAGVELLQREALRAGDVDQPEVAAAEHDQLGAPPRRAFGLRSAVRPAGRPPADTPEAGPARQVLEHRVDPAPALDAALDPGRLASGSATGRAR